jgi:hypothetical protein
MEHARKSRLEEGAGDKVGVLHDDQREHLEQLKKVLRRSLGSQETAPDPVHEAPEHGRQDMSGALDLVHQAAAKMRATEERARNREAHAEALAQRAQQALEAADQRVQNAEARSRAAEARAQDAENRAKEAEEYFKRLCSAIQEQFAG